MALSDIRSDVDNNINRDDVTDTQIDGWINDAQRIICRAENFRFMEAEATASTVDDQRKYGLPDGTNSLRFKEEISCQLEDADDDRVELIKIHKQDVESKQIYTETTDDGVPKYYCIQDEALHLYPLPDHSENDDTAWTINLEYYGYLGDLSNDTDTNDLIDNYPVVVKTLATALGLRWAGERRQSDTWMKDYRELLVQMIQESNGYKYGNIEEGFRPRDGSNLGDNALP